MALIWVIVKAYNRIRFGRIEQCLPKWSETVCLRHCHTIALPADVPQQLATVFPFPNACAAVSLKSFDLRFHCRPTQTPDKADKAVPSHSQSIL